MATTNYTLTCLGPVHVGTGTQFSKFDGVYDGGRWHLIDLDKVLARGADANRLATAMTNRSFIWATWLASSGISPADVAAYSLPCPQDPNEVAVREAMKDVYGHPYLPGTSIKGAIRTAALWRLISGHAPHGEFAARYLTLCVRSRDLFTEIQRRRAFDAPDTHRTVLAETLNVNQDEARRFQQTLYRVLNVREDRLNEQREWRNFQQRLERLGRNREWLGQPVERAVFGRDPNHDLMRAVQVSDTQPVAIERLAVGLVWTYTLRNGRLIEKREQDGEYKIFVEWLTTDTPLRLDIRVDDLLFSDAANSDLHFRGAKEHAVRQLAQTCNAFARSIITAEQQFYADHRLVSAERETSALRDFYTELETTLSNLPDGAFLLNVGWGGGWEVKTIGDLLRIELGEEGFNQLRQRYRLGENPRTHQFDDSFPKTRHIGYDGGAPMWPMGWMRLEPL